MYSKFLRVSNETGVPVNKVLDMFHILSSGEAVDNNEMTRMLGLSRNAANQIKKGLSAFFIPSSKDTHLTEEGVDLIKSMYSGDYKSEEALLNLLDSFEYQKALKILSAVGEKRPVPERKYDQFTATPETSARRTSLLSFFGDVRGKKLLFLGDDDFTSVATASLCEAENIVVADIDSRILEEIKSVSDDHNFRIETIGYDARTKLPIEMRGKFDVVFTDPPYTQAGVKLFVSRSVEALDKRNKAARIYACYGNSDRAKEKFIPIYDVFSESGLMIRWVFDKFNRYQGAEAIGSSSSLFVTEVTPKVKPLIKGVYDKPIYTLN